MTRLTEGIQSRLQRGDLRSSSRWGLETHAEPARPLAHERKSKIKIKIMKMIKRKSTIKSRIYFAELPLSYARDGF
jgi:hypothetical protein